MFSESINARENLLDKGSKVFHNQSALFGRKADSTIFSRFNVADPKLWDQKEISSSRNVGQRAWSDPTRVEIKIAKDLRFTKNTTLETNLRLTSRSAF